MAAHDRWYPRRHSRDRRHLCVKIFLFFSSITCLTNFITVVDPLEYLKTRSQLPPGLSNRIGPVGVTTMAYTGCGTMMLGNAGRTAARFCMYDFLVKQLQDESGNVSPPKALAAGLCAGMNGQRESRDEF